MILTRLEAKKYLRIDEIDTGEDLELDALIMAAEEFLKNAGCQLPVGNELAKLAVKILVVHWHENREPVGKGDKLKFSLDAILPQLKHCYVEVVV